MKEKEKNEKNPRQACFVKHAYNSTIVTNFGEQKEKTPCSVFGINQILTSPYALLLCDFDSLYQANLIFQAA